MKRLVTITDILPHFNAPLVVAASDSGGRWYVGIAYADVDADGLQRFAFVSLDRATREALLTGEMDLQTAMTRHECGAPLLALAYGGVGELVLADAAPELPAEALPLSGMFMAAELCAAA